MPEQFTYLATPYSKYPHGLEAAYHEACRAANLLRETRRIRIFCPIAEFHPIAMSAGIDPTDHEFWMDACRPFMRRAKDALIAKMDGWQDSRGIAQEITEFHAMGKNVGFVDWCVG